jgi:hypothetical protein
VDELEICGLVATRWCYPIERDLYVLKKHVRNKVKLETCMASGYMYDEALGFCTKYFTLYPHTRHHIWDVNEEEAD